MKKKIFAVIGLGKFGYAVAETLAKAGYEVLAVDGDNERVQAIAPYASYPLCADVTEPGVMESLDFSNVDVAVIDFPDGPEGEERQRCKVTVEFAESDVKQLQDRGLDFEGAMEYYKDWLNKIVKVHLATEWKCIGGYDQVMDIIREKVGAYY